MREDVEDGKWQLLDETWQILQKEYSHAHKAAGRKQITLIHTTKEMQEKININFK